MAGKGLEVTLGVGGGLGGARAYDPAKQQYAVTKNAMTRFGYLGAGLLEEADATGIAAGYRVVDHCLHTYSGTTVVPVILCTDGSATKVYYKTAGAAAWTEITPTGGDTGTAAFAASPGKCIASFFDAITGRNVIIVGFGTTSPYHWNASGGVPTKNTWTPATVTANRSEFMSQVHVQETGLATAQLIYAVDPTASGMGGIELYFTTVVNGAATGPTTIAPNTADYCTSITENDLGELFIGTRNKLYSLDENGLPIVVAGPFSDPPTADAGGQSDRRNFEAYAVLEDQSVLYVVEGRKIIRYRTGADPVTVRESDAGPRARADLKGGLPVLNLPVSAMVRIGEWVVVALTANTSLVTLANQPGGTTLLQNTLNNAVSELYVGRLVGGELVWWGSELTCTDRLRYLWFDPADSYLYLCSGDSESADLQQRRCYFFQDDPAERLVSGGLKLSTATPQIEWPPLDVENSYVAKGAGHVTAEAMSLTSSQTLTVSMRSQPDHDTSTAFRSIGVFTSSAEAKRGVMAPASASFDRLRVKAELGGGSGTAFPRLYGVTVDLMPLSERSAVPVF